MGKTTIEVTDSTWEALDSRKSRGDSFNDVIQDLLNESADGGDSGSSGEVPA